MRRHINDYPRRGVGLDTQYVELSTDRYVPGDVVFHWRRDCLTMCMSSNRYAWPSPMPCKIHVSMFRGECDEIAANCEISRPWVLRVCYCASESECGANSRVNRTSLELCRSCILWELPTPFPWWRSFVQTPVLWELVVKLSEMICVTEMMWKWSLFWRMLRSEKQVSFQKEKMSNPNFLSNFSYQPLRDGSLAVHRHLARRSLMWSDWRELDMGD